MPRYAAALWLELECVVTVLVICPDRKAAASFADPCTTSLPGYTLQPLVLGPDCVPPITDPKEVARNPERAVLSVMLHGQHRAVITAFLEGVGAAPCDPLQLIN